MMMYMHQLLSSFKKVFMFVCDLLLGFLQEMYLVCLGLSEGFLTGIFGQCPVWEECLVSGCMP